MQAYVWLFFCTLFCATCTVLCVRRDMWNSARVCGALSVLCFVLFAYELLRT